MRRFWDWIETEWYLAALGSRWRQIVWAPVLIPLTIVAELVDWLRVRRAPPRDGGGCDD